MALTTEQATKHVPTARPRTTETKNWYQTKTAIRIIQLLIIVAFLGLWEIASRSHWISPGLFGRPSGVATAFKDYFTSSRAGTSFKSSGEAVLVAFILGSIAGTVAGLILGISPTFDAIFGPFMTPLNSVPRIALAPLFIAWFGLTMNAKVVLAVSIVFFILAENARSAVRSVDPDLMTMARVVGLRNVSLVAKVVLPSAVPTLFAGLRLTFTYSLLGVIASEMIAAPNGIGQDIVFFSSSYQINTVFAILVGLMIVAMLVNLVFSAAERRLLKWQRP